MPDFGAILVHFSPELILVIGGLTVLIYDMVVSGRDARQSWLTLITLALAIGATGWLYMQEPATIFEARMDGEIQRAGTFISDGFTHLFRLFSMVTAALVILSGMAFMRTRTPYRGEFYAFVLFSALAMNLMAGSNDLIMVALSIEFLSITSYVLTGYIRDDALSIEGGLKYFLYGSITSAAMLFGLTWIYGAAGSTSLPAIAAVVQQPESALITQINMLVLPALLLVLAGIGFKVALVPFHQWSPDAYEGAPTPVTSFLSVGPKAAGFAVLLRVFTTIFDDPSLSGGWLAVLAALAAATMILGNFVALMQSDVKRLMAYSSIAQAGYMLVGVAAFGGAALAGITPLGSVTFFILAYLFTNLGAFAVIIAVNDATGSSDVSAFAGLMRRSPFMAISLVVFFLSLIGIPPLSGFVGKFAVFGVAIASGNTTLAVIGVLTGVVSVVYYFRVVREMFFMDPPDDVATEPLRVSPAVTFVVAASLAMTLIIGLLPGEFVEMANQAVEALEPIGAALASR